MFWISYSTSKCSWNGHNSEPAKFEVRELERNTSDGVNPTILIQFGSLVLRHAHALFVEPLLGAHISETVVANSIKSKLL